MEQPPEYKDDSSPPAYDSIVNDGNHKKSKRSYFNFGAVICMVIFSVLLLLL